MEVYQFCVYVLLVLSCLRAEVTALPEGVNCDRVKYTFEQKGFTTDIPRRVEVGGTSICGVDHCCTESMQEQISYHSRKQFLAAHNKTLADLSALLKSRADKFDDFFREMLNHSKRDFHEMFMKTYGVIYEQNSYVFTDLFKELERYYAKGQVDLTQAMDEFFNTLYQKMFTVLNAGYTFTDKYLECVNERMKELKPFGDVPSKLSTLLKRSFVATRTFSQALHVAADIVKNMQNMTITESCHAAVAKMSHCPACSGFNELKPCSDYCTNVMKGCLAYHSQLESHWNMFLDVTDKVVERLLGPFNIEMVVEPIDIKISEAIMNFQENSQQVSQRVFTGCGKPMLGRSKRANGEIEFETLDFSNRGNGGMEGGRGGRGDDPGKLEHVIKETRKVLKDTKSFWHKMPYHMCGETVTSNVADQCWNGKSKDKYLGAVIGDGITNQQKNPEVYVDISQPNSLINEQIFALKTINNKLRSAYNGMDVEWIDSEEFESSGSGSGSGPDIEEGSGMAPTEIPSQPPYSPFPPEPVPPKEDNNNINNNNNNNSNENKSNNNEPNEIPKIPDLKGAFNTTLRNQPAAGSASAFSRAAFSFIIPIILVSFGNTVIDWVL